MHALLRTFVLTVAMSPPAASSAPTDPVLEWNGIALHTAASAAFNPPLEARNLAIVHAAMFDAANAFEHEFRAYAVRVCPPPGASQEAAVIAAAHHALVHLYPEQASTLDALAAESLARLPDGAARQSGTSVGVEVAGRLLSLRSSDGAADAIAAPYTPASGPGAWQPTPPALRPALEPGWGSVVPFLLHTPGQFRPGPPPSLGSRRYATDLHEIHDVGSVNSSTRTPQQTALARLWVATAPQVWNPVARQLLAAAGLGRARAARVLALLHLAMADAFIATWEAKYTYGQWRPITAIRAADTDGNPRTPADPGWTPLIVTPPFPDYPAGHSSCAGAAEAVLERLLGRNPGVTIEVSSVAAPGVVVRARNVQEVAEGVVNARVWGGVHWRTSSEEGRRLGQRVGRLAVQKFLRPTAEGEPRAEADGDER